MSNDIIKVLEETEYSIEDYNKIIELCSYKIENIYIKNNHEKFLNNLKKMVIKNDEISHLFDIISGSIRFTIDKTNYYNQAKSIIITFDYKEYHIDLCLYCDEDEINYILIEEKINIINKKTHSYETHYKNCDEILLKILELKTVSKNELNDFIKELFTCVPVKII